MYAVIDTGGKQHRVALGDRLKVESLKAEPGAKINLENVLMVADEGGIKVGTPHLGTAVEATVIGHGRGKKVRIFKMRRRKGSRQHAGHRQNYTELEITRIGGAKSQPAKPAKPAQPTAEKTAPATEPEVDRPKSATPEATATADDLTQINGVGPVIVDKLNTIGITSLEQIAAFSDEDIERINGELNFKGRIERDDWVGQAKQLLKESKK